MSERSQENLLIISRKAIDTLISSGDGNAALLYLQILKNDGVFEAKAAGSALSLKAEEVENAFSGLVKLGLAEKPTILEREDAPPDYTAEDVRTRLGQSPEFKWLAQETQRRLGRILSGAELILLFGIFDYLGLPAEVIMMLITYSIEENRRRYGEGRMPTLRSIEKEAYIWAKNDILTQEQAENYLRRKTDLAKSTEELKKVFGIKNRTLSPTEEKYINAWIEMGFAAGALELAYDKTVVKTGALSWAYMNSIVRNWHSKGLHTVAEIGEGDGKQESRKPIGSSRSAPTQDEFERMKRYLDKLKQS